MVISAATMRALEKRAFAAGVDAAALMEEASRGIAAVVQQFFPQPGRLFVYVGKGNNGGDALRAAFFLQEKGWEVLLRLAAPAEEISPLAQHHLKRLLTTEATVLEDPISQSLSESSDVSSSFEFFFPPVTTQEVILDGLLGTGFRGVPEGRIATLCGEMEQQKRWRGASIVAIDLPSAMSIQADITVTLGWAKKELLTDGVTNFVGRLAVVPLPPLVPFLEEEKKEKRKIESSDIATQWRPKATLFLGEEVATASQLRSFFPARHFDVYKGCFGHLGIIAGAPGFLGAGSLSTLGALGGGAGLITLYALPEVYPLLAAKVPPEVMVKPVSSWLDVLEEPEEALDALVIGPGLASLSHDPKNTQLHQHQLSHLVTFAPWPTVVDAEALNALAEEGRLQDMLDVLTQVTAPRLLTPHPGEMQRLFPKDPLWSRREWATQLLMAIDHPDITLLLKGSRTLVATLGETLSYNSTGNPGMASGGMGDLLSGLLGALLAQGILPHHAAQLGAWLAGRAAELALLDPNCSEESLTATAVASCLGGAMKSLRRGEY